MKLESTDNSLEHTLIRWSPTQGSTGIDSSYAFLNIKDGDWVDGYNDPNNSSLLRVPNGNIKINSITYQNIKAPPIEESNITGCQAFLIDFTKSPLLPINILGNMYTNPPTWYNFGNNFNNLVNGQQPNNTTIVSSYLFNFAIKNNDIPISTLLSRYQIQITIKYEFI